MRIYSIVTAAIGGVLMVGVSTAALAGSFGARCGGGVVCNSGFNRNIVAYEGVRRAKCNSQIGMRAAPVPNCNRSVAGTGTLDRVNSYVTPPYGYLKTFEYKNTPNVNVTRVRSRAPMINLNDVSTGYSGGCKPAATSYCQTGGARLVQMPRPIMPAPVAQVRVGAGNHQANLAPRQYGDNVLTPGIAHIPTSIVDRSPITHIDGVPQQSVNSVTTGSGSYGGGYSTARRVAPAISRPISRSMGGNIIGHVSGGSYTYTKPGTPDYWEKTSGPTSVDGLPATLIICRRPGTAGATQTVNVVRPVIGVPYAAPTPVRVPVMARPGCAPMPAPMPTMPRPSGRWTY